jgi:hypothetical protein
MPITRDELDERFNFIQGIATKHGQDLAVMQKLLDLFQHSLFGNGQPGALKLMQDDIAVLKSCVNTDEFKKQREDIRGLLEFKWKLIGAVVVLQALGISINIYIKLKGL